MTLINNLPSISPSIYQNLAELPTSATKGAMAVVASSPPVAYLFDGSAWDPLVSTVSGSGVTNELTIWSGSSTLGSAGALTNGQVFIGSTGNAPVASTLTGTTNQVNVANGAGSITLSLPQSINTTAAPTFNQVTITNSPSASTDTVNLSYLQSFIQGLAWKQPAVVATTGSNITLSGEQTIDGVLTSSSRVLVKDQTSQLQNGIYVSAAGVWSRSADTSTSADLTNAAVMVELGSTNANKGYIQTTPNPTIGVSNIVWVQNFGAGTYIADESTLHLAGNTFSIHTGGVNLASSTVTGTLPVGNGGTGTAVSPSQYGVIYGSSTSAYASTAAGTVNYPLVANSGAAPTFQQLSLTSGVTGVLPVSNGGAGPASKLLWVDGTRTDSYTATGSISLPFKTISAAISQVITNADNATFPYTIFITPASYNETLTLNSSLLYDLSFTGLTFGQAETSASIVGPSSGSVITSTSNNTNLQNLAFNALTLNGNIILTGDTNNTNFAGTACVFWGCNIQPGNTGVILTNANNIYFYDTAFNSTGTQQLTFNNIAFGVIEQGDGVKTGWTVSLINNNAGNKPAQFSGNYVLCQRTTFSPTCTIDAGSELDILQSYIGGTSTITNNGTLHSWINYWKASLVLNSGSTTILQQDTLNSAPTINSGAILQTNGTTYGTTFQAGSPAHTAGTISIANGSASGANVTIQNLGVTTAYNFNLPTGAGTSGQPLLSAGGGSSSMIFSTLGISGGGTNSSTALNNNKTMVSSGGAIVEGNQSVSATNTQSGATYTVVTSDFGKLVRLTDTVARTITLPTTPVDGYWVELQDTAGTAYSANITVNAGGSDTFTVNGTGTYTIDSEFACITLLYCSSAAKWEIT